MIIKKIVLRENEDVTLTTYIQHPSHEMEEVKKKPAILVIPGGGYQMVSDREGEPVALAYMKAGYNAFVLKYSIKELSRFPRPLEDAEMALQMIIDNADEWCVDVNKIACIGFSAGGHLASQLGASKKVRPKALLLGYGAFIKSEEHQWNYPTVEIDKDYPESFIFHSFMDQVVPVHTSLWIAHELSRKGVPFDLHIFRDGQHGLSLGDETVTWGDTYVPDSHFAKWHSLSLEWLKKVL